MAMKNFKSFSLNYVKLKDALLVFKFYITAGFPLTLENLENLEKWEKFLQSGKSQGILGISPESQGKVREN